MTLHRRTVLGTAALGALPFRGARAQAAHTLRIGVLNDQSGVYRDPTGPGSTVCVRQAVAEIAGARGLNVEVIQADHQNRPDVGSSIVRQWLDRDGVDVVVDVPTSSVALAVAGIVREKNKVFLNSGGAISDLTGPACSPNTVHWTYDTWMLAHGTGDAMVRAGGDTWFFITADYAFGHALERDTTEFVRKAGGRVVGGARHPLSTTDYSSYLTQAAASRAKVIGLANAGGDTINCVKQAAEFGTTRRGAKLAGLLVGITDIHALGLETAQGLVLTDAFYWDLNDRTRAFTSRVLRDMPAQQRPTMIQAGCYGAVLHYLKAVAEMGAAQAKASGAETVARMKATPVDDDVFGPGSIRPDGRKIHPVHLFEVKAPAESRGPWDYYKLVRTIPADQAFRPIAEGGCPLVRS